MLKLQSRRGDSTPSPNSTATSPRRATLTLCHVLLSLASLTPILLLSASPLIAAVQEDEDESAGDERFTVIKAKKIITNVGDEIANGVIVISNGRIRGVGKSLEYPANSRIIDAADSVVMPGLINPHTRFGMSNYTRRGVHGDLTVAAEYFPEPTAFDEVLDAGYTVLAIYPDGAGIPGRAMIVRTAGKPEDRTLVSPAYLRVAADKAELKNGLKRAKDEIEKVEKARKDFEEKQKKAEEAAKAASQPAATQPASAPPTSQPASQPVFKPPDIDPAHQALVDLIQKKDGLFAMIEINSASDYLHMIDVLKEYPIARHFVLNYAVQSDFYRVAEKMGEQHEHLVMEPLLNHIPNSVERIHIIKDYSDAGCEVSLVPINDQPREFQSILPRVAELVRRGWSRDLGLKSLTLHPARLLGLEKKLGSIEKGKDADLIFLDTDPFDPFVKVQKVMIRGEIVHTTTGDAR